MKKIRQMKEKLTALTPQSTFFLKILLNVSIPFDLFFLVKCVTGSLSLYLMAASFVKFPIKYLPFQKVSHSTHHNRLVQSSTEQRQKDISLSLAHLNKLFFIGPNNPDYPE